MIKKRINSFKYAFAGIYTLLLSQPNARVHLIAGLIAVSLGFFFSIETIEWCIIFILIGMVFSAEAFNSALEFLCDKMHPDWDDQIGKVKDLAAAGVLFIAMSALIVGFIIFIPKILACESLILF
jgi:diacylglycerol kinase